MIYYVDCDNNGFDSIQDIIDENPGKVTIIDGNNYEETDKKLAGLVEKVSSDDLIIFDCIDSLANTLRGDAKMGTNATETVWKYAPKWLEGDKNYMTVYDMAEKMIMRRIKNLRNKGARILVLAHEEEKTDETDMLKKRGPDLNDKFYGSLKKACSDMFRLSVNYQDITDSSGKVIIPQYERILELRQTPEIIAKVHVSLEKSSQIKAKMVAPTLPKLYDHLGKKPSFLVVYGAAGVGKTTFSLSELIVTKTKGTK